MDASSRRAWLTAVVAAAAGGWMLRPRASTTVQTREVSGFQSVDWRASGVLLIEQTGRERLTIEAEPSVLAKVLADVRGDRLVIGFTPGRVESAEPVIFRLELKSLVALESTGSGAVRVGALRTGELSLRLAGSDSVRLVQLNAGSLDVQLAGAGELTVDSGRVERQRVRIAGAATYTAHQLECREADVAIDGGGNVALTVHERLAVRIAGAGEVVVHGNPRIEQSITGAGIVSPRPPGGRPPRGLPNPTGGPGSGSAR